MEKNRPAISYLVIILALMFVTGNVMASSDFYAYYTRLNYDIPVDEMLSYLPQTDEFDYTGIPLDGEEEEGEDEDEEEDGEDEEYDDEDEDDDEEGGERSGKITGKYADIIVNLSKGHQLVFSRETSYEPKWVTPKGSWLVDEVKHDHPEQGIISHKRDKDIGCLYSYSRIIKNNSDEIVIHWRYVPDFDNPDFDGVAHEFFTITPDHRVKREVRQATGKTDVWKTKTQWLKLDTDGIKVLSHTESLERHATASAPQNPTKTYNVINPDLWFKFDDAASEMTKENQSKQRYPIQGHKAAWKSGASGTALGFDGYYTKISVPASAAPKVTDAVSVESWVTLGANPWNWAPIVHHSIMDPGPVETGGLADFKRKAEERKPGKGYYLGVGPYNHALFVVNNYILKSKEKLPRNKWVHLAGSYGNGSMSLFVNGEEIETISVSGNVEVPAGTPLLVGINNQMAYPSDPVRSPLEHLPTIYGIEGLIDEVKVYSSALSKEQIKQNYSKNKPSDKIIQNPDIEKRVLPGEVDGKPAKAFGAYYTKLKYHDLWDNMWRSDDYSDVVIQFDSSPAKVVYWRGGNYGPGWVTDNNIWMADQSCEVWGKHGCSEHMADKDMRYGLVEIIENTPARVVIHWRYPSNDVNYLFPEPLAWADEYHTFYPDSLGIRFVTYHAGEAGWQDIQFFSQPDVKPLDQIDLQAITLANLDGKVLPLQWELPNKVPTNELKDACIELINFKSDYKVFGIFQKGTYITPWGHVEQSKHTHAEDPFAGPWNHWPVSQIPSDGRFAVDYDRVNHVALAAADNVVQHGNMGMYGFTNNTDVKALLPLAKSWNFPAKAKDVDGGKFLGYNKSQRAFEFTTKKGKLSFSLKASKKSPVVNPSFVVKNWNSDSLAKLKINDKKIKPGPDFRQGVTRDTEGKQMLVIWVKKSATKALDISISR